MGVVAWWPEREPDAGKRREESKEAYKLEQRREDIARIHRQWEQNRRQRYFDRIKENFVLREEHVVLLKAVYEWQLVEGSDWASIAASGKYPFGNSDWREDVYRILGWELTYDKEGVEEKWADRASDLMAELPHALTAILAMLDPATTVRLSREADAIGVYAKLLDVLLQKAVKGTGLEGIVAHGKGKPTDG